jgi:hypothetical protein
MRLELAGVDKRIPEVARMLRDEFQLDALTGAEVHAAVATYSRFLFRAARHQADGNCDEAFLHYVIALDLLCGGTDESTKSVTRRAACIIHRAKESSLEAAIRRVRALYDIRSKYVHEGRPVKEESLIDVQEVCREVLWSLMRVQRRPEARRKGFMDWWVKRLDYLCSAIEAGETPPQEEWARAGLA